MLHFMWIAWTILLCNSALGNPISEDPPLYSDFLSENTYAENTFALNDVETSSSISLDFTTQTLDSMNPKLLQPLENSWRADSPASIPDDTQLLADSLDTIFETASLSESSDALSANSCKIDVRDDFQLNFKRSDGGICTPAGETDPLPLLKLPDLDTLREILGSEQEATTKSSANIIPPIPGFTVDDDKMCPRPWRRLCCQGPVYDRNMPQGLLFVRNCRDFGPWLCPARYDVCCQGWVNFGFSTLRLDGAGYKCVILSENPNAVEWEGDPGQAPPL